MTEAAANPPIVAPIGKTAEHDHDHASAAAVRAELGSKRDGIGHHAAEAQATDETQRDELVEIVRGGSSERKRAKKAVQEIMMRLRPKRSASGPKVSAPIIRPMSPEANTGESAPWPSCQSRAMAGAT